MGGKAGKRQVFQCRVEFTDRFSSVLIFRWEEKLVKNKLINVEMS